jgi:hypothetical protein
MSGLLEFIPKSNRAKNDQIEAPPLLFDKCGLAAGRARVGRRLATERPCISEGSAVDKAHDHTHIVRVRIACTPTNVRVWSGHKSPLPVGRKSETVASVWLTSTT